jgi:hypothetical protein
MFTFSSLQTQVSYLVDDLNFGYFTPAQVQFWVNNAQREVQKKLLQTPGNWYVVPYQTLTVYGQSTYVLPSNFLKMHRVEIVLSGTPPNEVKQTLGPMTINEQDLVPTGVGTPSGSFVTQNTLWVDPAPDTASQILRIYYSYLVADMVNPTDVPDVPLQYQELIGLLASHDAFIKDGRDVTPLLGKMAYYDTLMKQDAEQRSVEEGRQITTTQGDAVIAVY